jgi:hypothetical protein
MQCAAERTEEGQDGGAKERREEQSWKEDTRRGEERSKNGRET